MRSTCLLIFLALLVVSSSAMPFYTSLIDDNGEDVRIRQFPQQDVLENMVNELMRVQSVDQMNNNQLEYAFYRHGVQRLMSLCVQLSSSPLCMPSGERFLFARVAQSVAAPHPQSSPSQVQLLEGHL
ncbi:Protein CBG00860 [Caenorhabditis briggsae]|uniref:Protein CBG00860 n=1 Tax=Caenorhabditis briggsae TaxID=6238 RepID=A8WPG0_CAEBR|nr:Protein CBG00860 [Caenorhabditis briggsae]CAP22367.2 Protein CBG00860 [Caenorhabditis briggsae]